MIVTRHAVERITERLTDAGLDAPQIALVLSEATRKDVKASSEAHLLARLPHRVNPAWGERSNGDQAWGIYREGRLVTVMLRRSTQPATPSSLRVDRVVI